MSVACTRLSKVASPRASSCISKPPELPSPGITGGVERYTLHSGYSCKSFFTWAITSSIVCPSRAPHGFRITVNSLRAWLLPTRGLLPTTLWTYSTAGFSIRYSTARSDTIRVRSSVAPSGNSNSTLKYPWSSTGKKLVGIRRFINKIATSITPNALNTLRGLPITREIWRTYLRLPVFSA